MFYLQVIESSSPSKMGRSRHSEEQCTLMKKLTEEEKPCKEEQKRMEEENSATDQLQDGHQRRSTVT
ncbi:hypothetical protein AMECASPLE_016160 [Ameca splendens]|uniref:Uncharacterized protein n=1 Tax=Ameca splendens TaxID=208324 RepID=A0ABV0Y200_9TELE